ncbi:MAG: RluA family pseudouridine synthase [Candidatus Cohnella colombiensis]|uniref:Pseudouridine synthase n=1 Tax=Candidatus Cohnella colombiensis TaxID=3121368 RepID=A0AA95EZA0_9BACL|nr:MAG: RluA family pseudouridine synthase [Cohnella sp.]
MNETTTYYAPLQFIADASDEGRRLRDVLRKRVGISRKLMVKLKMSDEGLTVNGEKARPYDLITAGDVIALHMETEQSEDILPQPIPVDIVFEDEHILVVNKRAGIIVHPTTGHYTNTLANGIVYHWQERGERVRFRPVNRLDEHTSGLVLIAKHVFASQQLGEQMKAGTIEKQYRAYVYGQPPGQKGEVNAPIGRQTEDPHRRVVREDGAPSLTYYEVADVYGHYATSLDVRLGTGRTHQIRVHLTSIGCPLIGDSYYSLERWSESEIAVQFAKVIERQALHAVRLAFDHPVTGVRMEHEASLPEDLLNLEAMLREIRSE